MKAVIVIIFLVFIISEYDIVVILDITGVVVIVIVIA